MIWVLPIQERAMDLRGRSLLRMTSLTAGEFNRLHTIKALMIATKGGPA